MRKIFIVLCLFLLLPSYGLSELNRSQDEELTEAKVLNDKVEKLYYAGRYEEAIPYAKRALEIREKVLGEHSDTTESLNNLAELYRVTGRYSEAERLFKRALEMRKKVLGEEHHQTAESFNNLATLYMQTGRYSEAEFNLKTALEIYKKTLGDHPDTAANYNNLAEFYRKIGRYNEAEPLYKTALRILETHGTESDKNHFFIVTFSNNLGTLYSDTGRYKEAELNFSKALEKSKKALGEEHPATATCFANLGVTYGKAGNYNQAEPLLKRALEISKKTLGEEHPATATNFDNLGRLYSETGRYKEAEPLYTRALKIRKKVLGMEHPDTATSLNNLAMFYITDMLDKDTFSNVEPYLKDALEIRKKALGMEHPDTAESLNNLSMFYMHTERYSEAEPLYKEVIAIDKKTLGKEHPDAASSLNNLGMLYKITGRYSEAEPLYKEALEIRKKALSMEHPKTAESLINLAYLYDSTNNHIQSHKLFNQGVSIFDKNRENTFLLLSDRQKLSYIKSIYGRIHAFISQTVNYMSTDNSATIDTLNAWLKWKGAVLESKRSIIDAVEYSNYPVIEQKFDELTDIQRRLAKFQLSQPSSLNIPIDEYKKRIDELRARKDSLEIELTKLSKDFAFEKLIGKADITNISKVLPKDSVYLDFANIRPYDSKEQKLGDAYYLVFVLLPENPPQVKLLTIAKEDEINTHINNYLAEMAKPKIHRRGMPKISKLNEEAKALYEKVLKPVEPYFKSKKSIYISPDGNLNLIPFELFVTPDGKYLMENYEIDYVTAGRDIMRFADTAKAEDKVLVMADPDYDMGLVDKQKVTAELNLPSLKGEVLTELRKMKFPRLPVTKEEADTIEKILKDKFEVKNLQGKQAIEEVLLDAKKPRFVHLSTHGFFLEDKKLEPGDDMQVQSMDEIRPAMIENPMLRSGLLFAGFKKSIKEGRDDGILTAEKILGLRLKGTELVVLSACETGTGNVSTGEGVFGLKRAFILSGAKTVVMSLWSVPAKETTELMTDFYQLMEQGRTKSEALKQAKLNMKAKKDNPFYWGAFVMVGNPN